MHRVQQNFHLQRFIAGTLEGLVPTTHMISRVDRTGKLAVYSTELQPIRAGEMLNRKQVIDFFAQKLFIALFFKESDHHLHVTSSGDGFVTRGKAFNVGKDTDGAIGFFDYGISAFELNRLNGDTISERRAHCKNVILDAATQYRSSTFNPFTDAEFTEAVTERLVGLFQEFMLSLFIKGPYQERFERTLRDYNSTCENSDEKFPLSLKVWRAYARALKDELPQIIHAISAALPSRDNTR